MTVNIEEHLTKCLEVIKNHNINLTEENIFDFLKITYRWPFRFAWGQPSVEVISEYGYNSSECFFNQQTRFQFDEWKKFYDAGFTTILSNVLDLNFELRELSDKLFDLCGTRINGNFYFSKGTTDHRVSFPSHSHEYNVIVKPLYGKCKWIIDGEHLINPEEAFIIPAKSMHSVYECTEKKLSLTINLQ